MVSYSQELKWDEQWEINFQLLVKYNEMYGTILVPNRILNLSTPKWERKLGSWVNTQSQSFKNGKLKSWRYDKLVSVEFDFEPFETRFENHFQDFLKFKAIHGHAMIPQDCTEYPSIGAWASHLRDGPVSEIHKKRLDEAGFIWDYIEEIWQINYRNLINFHNKFGHYKVSEKKKGYEQLGTWVVRMSKAKRYGLGYKLSDAKIKLLDDIGFNWNPEQYDWDRNYNNLLRFINVNGHCLVPVKRCNIWGLGWWVSWIRKNKHKVKAERIKMLDELGFEWDADIAYRKRNNIKPKSQLNFK